MPRASSEHMLYFRPLTVAIQAALERRGITAHTSKVALAATIGCRPETVWAIQTGRMVPGVEFVARLADALDAANLITISDRLRSKNCAVCEQPFVDSTSAFNRVYCCITCHGTGNARNKREMKQEKLVVQVRLLDKHRLAVAAFCNRCTDSVCPDATCELRPVSPKPLPRGQRVAEVRRLAPWVRSRRKA